ncbi:crooked neck-like protein 1 [Tanacetum coccineum]|uniref:Crooked neck-like protein 1 n=1 Tax=Tanacetum coccineum TaxID=301880 RepID=A0ABQ5GTB1_9ASTR
MRCLTDESRCYRYTLDGQRMSRDAIVVHKMFNGRVEMLLLYIRCSTEESRGYRYTLDVEQMSRTAIVVHEICRPDPPSPLLLPFRAAENYLNHLAAAAAATVPTHLACRNRKRFPQGEAGREGGEGVGREGGEKEEGAAEGVFAGFAQAWAGPMGLGGGLTGGGGGRGDRQAGGRCRWMVGWNMGSGESGGEQSLVEVFFFAVRLGKWAILGGGREGFNVWAQCGWGGQYLNHLAAAAAATVPTHLACRNRKRFPQGHFAGGLLECVIAVGMTDLIASISIQISRVSSVDDNKGIIPAIKTVYPNAEHIYCFRHIHENMKQGWCGQAYKDLLWRAASATNVRDFEKCRAKSDLLLNNICEAFNGKIVGGRDKPAITLLEYIREYCMKGIVNVQGVIDKCTGPLTLTATRIMESIKKEAHLMKVQWNGSNKYQVLGLFSDQCIVDVVSMTCSCRKWELKGVPCKHAVAACWNMGLNDRAAPPPETWVNPCYWLSTWNETYSYKIQPICGTNYWEKSTCPTTLLSPKHYVQVGRPKKKRKRSKHEDEPFVKDGKLSRKGRTITCQSCGNIGHNKATCKGQGRKATTGGNNAEGSGLSAAAAGEGGAGDPGGVGVASQGSSCTRWTRRRVQTERISPQKRTPTQPANQPYTSSQVLVSQTRNADGREMGDGVPTQQVQQVVQVNGLFCNSKN